MVTSGNPSEAMNFGLDEHVDHAERYDRARETNASKGSRQKVVDLARQSGMTVRQLCQQVGGSYGSLEMIGTPTAIADQMEEWLFGEACDGFNVMFPYLPGGLDDFVDRVVPELQRRNLFRREYEGSTLRDNVALARPKNRFFA